MIVSSQRASNCSPLYPDLLLYDFSLKTSLSHFPPLAFLIYPSLTCHLSLPFSRLSIHLFFLIPLPVHFSPLSLFLCPFTCHTSFPLTISFSFLSLLPSRSPILCFILTYSSLLPLLSFPHVPSLPLPTLRRSPSINVFFYPFSPTTPTSSPFRHTHTHTNTPYLLLHIPRRPTLSLPSYNPSSPSPFIHTPQVPYLTPLTHIPPYNSQQQHQH